MKEIPLTRDLVAKVDDEDFEKVSQYDWCIQEGECGKMYACTKKSGYKLMHHFIVGQPLDTRVKVDHKNGDGLDNQKSNLRFATHSQNLWNRGKNKNGTNKYKGVTFFARQGKYAAKIGVNGERIFLGYFRTEEAAALAYNEASKKYHGEFGYINEVPSTPLEEKV